MVNKPKEYKKLDKTQTYDKEVVEELAEAYSEISILHKRLRELETIVSEHKDLEHFLWFTANGEVLALHKIEDGHFQNILNMLSQSNKDFTPAIKSEARRRKMDLPMTWNDAAIEHYGSRLIDAEINNDWRN